MKYKDKVKYVRNVLKYSQEQLAHALGVSFATVNRWETGKSEPSQMAKIVFDNFCKQNSIIFPEE